MIGTRAVVASADPDVRHRVTAVLQAGGATVMEFASAKDALVACLDREADVAILDDALPTLTGSEVAEVLRDAGSRVVAVVIRPDGEPPASIVTLDIDSPTFDRDLLDLVRGHR